MYVGLLFDDSSTIVQGTLSPNQYKSIFEELPVYIY